MQYSEQHVGNVLVVGLDGRLDVEAEDGLLSAFDGWMKDKPDIVMDCTHLEFIDSSGLGILLRLLKRAMGNDRDVRFANINEQVRMLFEITRADQIFQVFATTDDAIHSFA
ncbi:STAS domain-containing protein [Desulforhopalus vacuolatus]|uniref:STAS domain-containing protein n=1 Tax=Desulforhopalus vacuolatus TaxID=40414 RepID=UPI0019654644|nr:STAS domain-containing protein [Desulforhopalus vacuolatus]MBM9520173.1 STAS domain-containing protein [Desulforhopalus vacuolatus]